MNWFSRFTKSGKPDPSEPEADAESSPQELPEIELAGNEFEKSTIECARHALVMGYRAEFKCDPSNQELKAWVATFWNHEGKRAAMIQRHNKMAFSFSQKIPNFWDKLNKTIF